MPNHKPFSAFVWYHAEHQQERAFQAWLKHVQSELNIQAKLYKRMQNEKTTFMEVFEHVGCATIEKIEQLATQQHCFNGIHRQCESFERITTP
ncbi:MAG: hypothetical protein Q9M21_01095 [Mariprofundaceae bacterium]|nr:hypothetical protein [Mariprofundaceae bacterium]